MKLPGEETPKSGEDQTGKSHRGRWLMVACCGPILAIGLIIAVRGVGLGFLVFALLCLAMMAAMMGMSHGGRDD
jgi:hypothetical protein